MDYSNRTNENNNEVIKFIPIGDTGPEQVLIDETTNTIYTSLKDDNLVAVIDGSANAIKENITLQKPRAMSTNPLSSLLYVASGENRWFNVMDTNTNKVIAKNTQIAYPIASAVDTDIGRIYVADCHSCDNHSFTNGTSIYVLDKGGLTLEWQKFEDIKFEENMMAFNPVTQKLYTIGTDIKSGISNLYIIDVSLR